MSKYIKNHSDLCSADPYGIGHVSTFCMDDFCFPETGEGRILLSDRMDSKGSGMEQLSGDLEEGAIAAGLF